MYVFLIWMSLIYLGKPLVPWYIYTGSSSYMILYFMFTSLEKMFSKSIFGTMYVKSILHVYVNASHFWRFFSFLIT